MKVTGKIQDPKFFSDWYPACSLGSQGVVSHSKVKKRAKNPPGVLFIHSIFTGGRGGWCSHLSVCHMHLVGLETITSNTNSNKWFPRCPSLRGPTLFIAVAVCFQIQILNLYWRSWWKTKSHLISGVTTDRSVLSDTFLFLSPRYCPFPLSRTRAQWQNLLLSCCLVAVKL